MQRQTAIKILGAVLICWLLVNMVLFGLGRISNTVFWITIGVFAIVAYRGVPMLRKV